MATQVMHPRDRGVIPIMIVGMTLTAIATVVPFIDRVTTAVMADHIREGYPAYEEGEIGNAVTVYLVILATIGVLGLAGWLASLWAVQRGKNWARWLATGLLVSAICLAIAGLTVRDTSGDIGLAPLMGWLLILPCLPGLMAVARMWKPEA